MSWARGNKSWAVKHSNVQYIEGMSEMKLAFLQSEKVKTDKKPVEIISWPNEKFEADVSEKDRERVVTYKSKLLLL